MTQTERLAEGMVLEPLRAVRPEAYSAVSFEAFNLSRSTTLYDPLAAKTLPEAEVEVTSRWAWDRGDRFALREIGPDTDLLHVYAVRRKSAGMTVWNGYIPSTAHERWLDRLCTIDLNVVAGIPVGLIGSEAHLHDRRERQRPVGARLTREK